jgi:hypothetical protein
VPSVQNQIIEAIEALWRGVVTELRPGEQGFLRGKRSLEDMTHAKLPYLLAHSPAKEESWEGTWLQVDANYAVAFELWSKTSQPEMLDIYDAVREALRADFTLGGLVKKTLTSAMALDEAVDKDLRALGVIFTASVWES